MTSRSNTSKIDFELMELTTTAKCYESQGENDSDSSHSSHSSDDLTESFTRHEGYAVNERWPPGVLHIKEIFPQYDLAHIQSKFLKCEANIESTINELLITESANDEKLSNVVIPTIEKECIVSDNYVVNLAIGDLPPSVNPNMTRRNSIARRNSIIKKRLPFGFLDPPKFRTVVTHCTSLKIEFTVYFNRASSSIGINVHHLGDYVIVNELFQDTQTKQLGIAGLSGVKVGDILCGINELYFDKNVTLTDLIAVINCSGNYLNLQFVRYIIPQTKLQSSSSTELSSLSSSPKTNSLLSHANRNDAYINIHNSRLQFLEFSFSTLTSISNGMFMKKDPLHPVIVLLLEQNIIDVNDIEDFSCIILRLKKRILQWYGSKDISVLCKIGDIEDTNYSNNSGNMSASSMTYGNSNNYNNGSESNSYVAENFRRIYGISHANLSESSIFMMKRICKSWQRNLTLSTVDLQPALCIRVINAYTKDSHVQYAIWVNDVSSGLEWTTRRRYNEFHAFREELIAIWPALERIEFPKRRLTMSDNSSMVSDRLLQLNSFLKKVYIKLVIRPIIHRMTRQMYILLQNFLDIPFRLYNIRLLAAATHEDKVNTGMTNCKSSSSSLINIVSYVSGGESEGFTGVEIETTADDDEDDDDDNVFNNIENGSGDQGRAWHRCDGENADVYQKEDADDDGNEDVRNRYICHASIDINQELQWVNKDGLKYRRIVETYIQNVLHMPTFQLAINTFVSRFRTTGYEYISDYSDQDNPKLSLLTKQDNAVKYLQMLSSFIDNLQQIIVDGFRLDCMEIIFYYKNKNDSRMGTSGKQTSEFNRSRVAFPSLTSPSWNGVTPSSELLDKLDELIDIAVRRQVEIEVFLPCRDLLNGVLSYAYGGENNVLYDKCCLLSHLPQTFFGISVDFISPSSWITVVDYFTTMVDKMIPYDKMEMLVTAAAEIPKVYSVEKTNPDRSMGADDVLPIFIYSLVMSKTKALRQISKEFDYLCDPRSRVSETGYYIATLEASLQYISEIDEINGLKFSH